MNIANSPELLAKHLQETGGKVRPCALRPGPCTCRARRPPRLALRAVAPHPPLHPHRLCR